MDAQRESLGGGTKEAVEEIGSLTRAAAADLVLVQRRLGELNYILAEGEMNDLEVFDRYRDRILGALRSATEDLSLLTVRGAEWSRHGKDLGGAWHQLSQQLDSVHKHLEFETDKAEAEFDSERVQLSDRLDKDDTDDRRKEPSVDIVNRLRREFQQILPGIKTMFMYADESLP